MPLRENGGDTPGTLRKTNYRSGDVSGIVSTAPTSGSRARPRQDIASAPGRKQRERTPRQEPFERDYPHFFPAETSASATARPAGKCKNVPPRRATTCAPTNGPRRSTGRRKSLVSTVSKQFAGVLRPAKPAWPKSWRKTKDKS